MTKIEMDVGQAYGIPQWRSVRYLVHMRFEELYRFVGKPTVAIVKPGLKLGWCEIVKMVLSSLIKALGGRLKRGGRLNPSSSLTNCRIRSHLSHQVEKCFEFLKHFRFLGPFFGFLGHFLAFWDINFL